MCRRRKAVAVVPDPRRPSGWRPGSAPIPLVALLQQTGVAPRCGAGRQSAVAQWGRERLDDDSALLEALGLPPGRSPCVATLHRLDKQVDVAAFGGALGAWLARTDQPRSATTSEPVRPVSPWMGVHRLPTGRPTGGTTPPIWLQRERTERGGRRRWFLDASPKVRPGRRAVRVGWALADPEQNASVGSSGTQGTPGPHLPPPELLRRTPPPGRPAPADPRDRGRCSLRPHQPGPGAR